MAESIRGSRSTTKQTAKKAAAHPGRRCRARLAEALNGLPRRRKIVADVRTEVLLTRDAWLGTEPGEEVGFAG